MKVALVYDRVNKFGGAERVLLSLHKIFPQAPLYTLVYDKHSAPWAAKFKVIASFLNYFPFFRKRHELLAPLAPLAFETLSLSDYDLVLSVTSSDAKAVITKPNQLHICYCLTPTRYFWSGAGEYKKDKKVKLIPRWLFNYFRTVDLLISQRPDEYIAISKEVKARIKKYYHREASVIYPSIDDKFYTKKTTPFRTRKYYLIVSRLVPYKKVDLAVKVFSELKKPLLVVGTGSEAKKLLKISGPSVKFVGSVSDSELITFYQNAKAVIFPQTEDYGLVPLEAQACGTPVIAYRKGGALETIVEKETGLFFNHQTQKSLKEAIGRFEKMTFSPQRCQKNALRFSEAGFRQKLSAKINRLWSNHLSDTAG